MKRDMELTRKILFKIEAEVDNTAEYDLNINDYTIDQVAYHCSILYDGGYVKDYKASYAGGKLYSFGVSGLTWAGHEFLETIRNDTVWNKTKETITKNGLSMAVDVVKEIATSILEGMTQVAIKSLIN